MTKAGTLAENSWVNRIDGVSLDASGVIHTQYGAFNPVTGEGLPIAAPRELMHEILVALIRDGEESGPAEPFDWDAFMECRFGSNEAEPKT